MTKKRGGCKGGGQVPDGAGQVIDGQPPDVGSKCGAEHGCHADGACPLELGHDGKHKCDKCGDYFEIQ